jgi:hypothetical protein
MCLKKLALIVDGPTEEGSLRVKFNMTHFECPEIRTGPGNGITYSIEGYSKGVLPTIKLLLKTTIRAIILVPDLEKRKIKPEKYAKSLKEEIIMLMLTETKFSKEYLEDVIYVCPPNIMFENWIISDIEGIKNSNGLISGDAKQAYFDGKNGSSELKKIMTTKYKKTVHAKQLFKKTRDVESVKNSDSYNNFIIKFNELVKKHCPQHTV